MNWNDCEVLCSGIPSTYNFSTTAARDPVTWGLLGSTNELLIADVVVRGSTGIAKWRLKCMRTRNRNILIKRSPARDHPITLDYGLL